MQHLDISEADAVVIGAILATHAEMQDQRAIQSMELLGRLKKDEPEEVGMHDCLQEHVDHFEDDTENLKRLARIFGAAL